MFMSIGSEHLGSTYYSTSSLPLVSISSSFKIGTIAYHAGMLSRSNG